MHTIIHRVGEKLHVILYHIYLYDMCIQVIQKKLSFKNLKSKYLKYRSKMHHGFMTCGYNVTRLKMGVGE